ncbi:MAG: hypothetical protein H6P95_2875, partial [Candidatus Aminicenantes bacterium]|nr:hypothetical protein [Candidatus Aminicenantes bacterium]
MEAVGDGLGDPRVEAPGLDPLLFVDPGLFVEERSDRFGVPVAIEVVGHGVVAVPDPRREGQDAVGTRSIGAGQASGRRRGGFGRAARPDPVERPRRPGGAAADLAVREKGELALETPREIVDEGHPDVLGTDDAADDGL